MKSKEVGDDFVSHTAINEEEDPDLRSANEWVPYNKRPNS